MPGGTAPPWPKSHAYGFKAWHWPQDFRLQVRHCTAQHTPAVVPASSMPTISLTHVAFHPSSRS